MAEPFVRGREVAKEYEVGAQRVTALEPATFTVEAGARIALVGPSGSGKTTLLHLIGGLDQASSGTLEWPALGPRGELRPRHVLVIFQTPSLVPVFTARENVELPLLLAGLSQAAARVEADRSLDAIDLAALSDRMAGEMSGGQSQRIAVARALAMRPQLVLADEPTGQLDAATADALMTTLLVALDGTQTALLVATHDESIARTLDSTWRISHGRLSIAT